MVKNEEKTIQSTIESTSKYIKHRMVYCAIKCNKPHNVITSYMLSAVNMLEAYIGYFTYCIVSKNFDVPFKLITGLINFNKNDSNMFISNEDDYIYNRWHILSIFCINSKTHLDIGKKACENALKVRNDKNDIDNLSKLLYLTR